MKYNISLLFQKEAKNNKWNRLGYPTPNQIDGARVSQNKVKPGQNQVKLGQKSTSYRKGPRTPNYVVPFGNWSCEEIQWSKRFVMPFAQSSF